MHDEFYSNVGPNFSTCQCINRQLFSIASTNDTIVNHRWFHMDLYSAWTGTVYWVEIFASVAS